MSVTSLLKNIYSFLDILQKAHSSEVQSWTKQDVDNALRWAEYCQKVHREALGKSYEASLDKQIRTLGELPWALGGAEIRLEFFRNARFITQKALLQNPFLPEELFTLLIETACRSGHTTSIIKVLLSITVPKVTVYQLILMTRRLLANQEEDGDIIQKLSNQCEAKLIHHHFGCVAKTSRNIERLKKYIHQQLEAITSENSGLEIILMSLQESSEDENETYLHQSIILDWMLQNLNMSTATRSPLKICPRELVCSVAERHSKFHQVYIQWLMEWGEDMEIIYTPEQKSLYTWRVTSENFSTYEDLKKHFLLLLKGSEECKKKTIEVLAPKVRRGGVTVWKDIGNYLIDCFR